MSAKQQHYCLIACEVLRRELDYCRARSPHRVDARYLDQGLHELGAEGVGRALRQELEQLGAADYDALLLGYGLCNNGIVGLSHPALTMIVPRAHDCVALFLGSRRRYDEYFQQNPGTYFETSGWLDWEERHPPGERDVADWSIRPPFTELADYATLVERYGEENAAYLQEAMGQPLKHYRKMAYIAMPGIDDSYADRARTRAEQAGLEYATLEGDLGLLQRLVDGQLDAKDFLVLPPGNKIKPTYREDIIGC